MTAPGAVAPDARPGRWGRLTSLDPLDVVPRLAPLLVLPTARGAPLVLLGGAYALVVLSPRIYRHPLTWLGLATAHLAPLLARWEGVDNHEWLIGYWLLALGLAFLARDPAAVLATEGPVLVGLVFAFAVVWKLTSGQYLDGSFFRYTLLADARFEPVATGVLGLPDGAHAANLRDVASLRSGGPPATLRSVAAVGPAALVMTWWGLGLEALLAVAHLVPRRWRLSRARLPLLALFAVSTYVVVPVVTFGLVLALMTYPALDGPRSRRAGLALVAFLVVWSPIWRAATGIVL